MKKVRIIATDPAIDITVPMGDGPATITQGLGGWQVVDRQDDIAATDWTGQEPLVQAVPLLLDGFSKGESVERDLNTIFKLARDVVGDEHIPPIFKVFGPIYFSHKEWVLPDGGIELDSASVIREDDGTLLRQALTLRLLEYVKPDTITIRGKGKQRTGLGKARPVSYTTRAGDTLAKIAARIFGDWTRWKEIGRKNGISDPNRVLRAGRVLAL